MATPVLTVGPLPVEARGGNPFDDGRTHTGIRSMKIGLNGGAVVSICTKYENNGQPEWSPTHGPNGNTEELILDYPNEFLVSVSGTYTVESQHLVIQTLIIKSNIRLYPYGTAREGARSFSTKSTGCKIVGFHGRSGHAMDSIGTYLVPLVPQGKISIGPFGVPGGVQFDDGTHPPITGLQIRFGDGFVSIQTLYGDNDLSDEHGRKPGGTTRMINLDLDEYLISLSGYYDTEGFNPAVQSLTFQSNIREYGPFGDPQPQWIPFSTATTAGTGRIVGFHGTSDEYIHSIGAHFEPLP